MKRILNAEETVKEAMHFMARSQIGSRVDGGKIRFDSKQADTTWVYIKHHPDTDCYLWRDITYNFISRRQSKKLQFVPAGCQSCWKVVCRPFAYDQLALMVAKMKGWGFASKIGIEKRSFVRALYGAYFYTRSLEEARQRADFLKAHLTFADAYIKRGCTEMEIEQGPSDKWEITPWQLEIENCVKHLIHTEPNQKQSPERLEAIYELWDAFAWKYDSSYLGKDLVKPAVRYS